MFQLQKQKHTYIATARGFTLLELLVYISIFAVVAVVFMSAFINVTHTKARADAMREVESSMRKVSDVLSRDIEGAVSVSAASTTLTVVYPTESIVYTVQDGRVLRRVGVRDSEAVTPPVVMVNALMFSRAENKNAVFDKKTESIIWNISASYRSNVPEYGYNGSQSGSASIRYYEK